MSLNFNFGKTQHKVAEVRTKLEKLMKSKKYEFETVSFFDGSCMLESIEEVTDYGGGGAYIGDPVH